MSRRQIKDSVVVITGASSGIGKQLAIQLSAQGARIVANARRADRLEELKNAIENNGGQLKIIVGDVTESDTRQRIVSETVNEFGGIDILVNNAGVGAIGNFSEASEERLRKIMEVNFFALTEMTRVAIPHLLKSSKQPMIVNISSVLGHRAVPLKSEYCASKFAVHGFSDSLRAELSKQNIDVLLVSPSTTASEFFDSVLEDASGKNPKLGTPMSPEQVAAKTIKAMKRGKHEIILSAGGKSLVWLDRFCPPLANYLMKKHAQ